MVLGDLVGVVDAIDTLGTIVIDLVHRGYPGSALAAICVRLTVGRSEPRRARGVAVTEHPGEDPGAGQVEQVTVCGPRLARQDRPRGSLGPSALRTPRVDRTAARGLGGVAGSSASGAALSQRLLLLGPLRVGTGRHVRGTPVARTYRQAIVRRVKALREAIETDTGLRRTTEVLRSTLGVGLTTAAVLRAFRTGARMNPPHFQPFVIITLDFRHGMLTSRCKRVVVAAIVYNGFRGALRPLGSLAPARYASVQWSAQSVLLGISVYWDLDVPVIVYRELPIAGPIDLPQLVPR